MSSDVLGHAYPAGTVVQFRRVRPGPLNRWAVAAGPIPAEHGDALLLVDLAGRSDPDYYEPSSVEPATGVHQVRQDATIESFVHNPGPGHFAPAGARRWSVKLEKNSLYGKRRLSPVVEGPVGEEHVVDSALPVAYGERRFGSPDVTGVEYTLDEVLAAMRVPDEERGPIGALLLALPPRAVLRVEGYSAVRRVR